MKRILILLAGILFTVNSIGQNYNTVIKTQAMEMVRALMRKDYPAFSKYIHPKVIEMAGGSEKLVQRMDTVNSIAKQFGAKIKKVIIGEPAKITGCNKELQTTLPQTTDMETLLGTLTVATTLIAISSDAGKNWVFIDTSLYNLDELKKSMPGLCTGLVVPAANRPKFIPKQ
jgi:hypothetical protein